MWPVGSLLILPILWTMFERKIKLIAKKKIKIVINMNLLQKEKCKSKQLQIKWERCQRYRKDIIQEKKKILQFSNFTSCCNRKKIPNNINIELKIRQTQGSHIPKVWIIFFINCVDEKKYYLKQACKFLVNNRPAFGFVFKYSRINVPAEFQLTIQLSIHTLNPAF